MKGAIIHGVLLVVMLVYGYKTWSRDKSVDTAVSAGEIVLWNKAETDLVAIEYASPTRTVRLERRGEGAAAYWWGLETKELPPRPPAPALPPAPGMGTPTGPTPRPATPAPGPPGAKPGAPAKPAAKPAAPATPPAAKPAAPATPPAAKPAKPPAAKPAAPATPPAAKPAPPVTPPAAPTKPPAAKPVPAAGSAGPAKMADPNAVATPGTGSAAPTTPATTAPADPLGASVAADQPPPLTTTREFPVSEVADKVIKGLTRARALRDLGAITDANRKDFKLDDTSITLSIVFQGETRSFVVGGSVFGGGDRYVLDTDSGKGYVLSGPLISPFEQGESTLRLTDPRGFDATKIHEVTIAAADKTRAAVRVVADAPEADTASPHAPPPGKTKTWGDPATGKPDQTLANFIDNLDRLRPTKYEADLDPATMTEVVKLSYRDAKATPLGSMRLFKRELAPDPGAVPVPANPPGPTIEYYIVTEKTRVPGLVPKGMADRVDQDIATVFPK